MTLIRFSRFAFPLAAYPDRCSCTKYVPGSTSGTLNWPVSSVNVSYGSRLLPEPPIRTIFTFRIPAPPGSCPTLPCTILFVPPAAAAAPPDVPSCPTHSPAHIPTQTTPNTNWLMTFMATSRSFLAVDFWRLHLIANMPVLINHFELGPER